VLLNYWKCWGFNIYFFSLVYNVDLMLWFLFLDIQIKNELVESLSQLNQIKLLSHQLWVQEMCWIFNMQSFKTTGVRNELWSAWDLECSTHALQHAFLAVGHRSGHIPGFTEKLQWSEKRSTIDGISRLK